MGLFSVFRGSVFDSLVGMFIIFYYWNCSSLIFSISFLDKATSESNTDDDWKAMMDVCDRVAAETDGAKECARSIIRRFKSTIPHVHLQCLSVSTIVKNQSTNL